MPILKSALLPLFVIMSSLPLHAENHVSSPLIDPLDKYVELIKAEKKHIPEQRKKVLNDFAAFIARQCRERDSVNLMFICTHNSRRSHMAQISAQTAAAFYGIPNVQTYSGGTEATACNIRTVRALRRAGFSVAASTESFNPVYLVQYSENRPALKAFSKVYDSSENPKDGFAAVMTCSDADQNCPVVSGSITRVSLPYVDPKVSDDTPSEDRTYDDRLLQIATEQFYVMEQARKLLDAMSSEIVPRG